MFKITKSKVYKLVNKSKEYKPNKLKKMNRIYFFFEQFENGNS